MNKKSYLERILIEIQDKDFIEKSKTIYTKIKRWSILK